MDSKPRIAYLHVKDTRDLDTVSIAAKYYYDKTRWPNDVLVENNLKHHFLD